MKNGKCGIPAPDGQTLAIVDEIDHPIPYNLTELAYEHLKVLDECKDFADFVICICGHAAYDHAEFLDKSPLSKLVESPILKHCLSGWTSSTGFQCRCPVYHPRQVK